MTREYTFDYETYTADEIPQADAELIEVARNAAAELSYAPYSEYRVGAAARLDDGSIIRAANQESSVFPAGLCAERVLLFAHMAAGNGKKIVSMAIASIPDTTECHPCGGCRQVMTDVMERQGAPFRIIMSSAYGATIVSSPSCLLPFAFTIGDK